MKRVLIILVISLASQAHAGNDVYISNSSALFTAPQYLNVVFQGSGHQMIWKPDGTVEIDGKTIDRLSDPEIKEAIKSIAKYLIDSTHNDSMLKQTDYLLKELQKCQNQLKTSDTNGINIISGEMTIKAVK